MTSKIPPIDFLEDLMQLITRNSKPLEKTIDKVERKKLVKEILEKPIVKDKCALENNKYYDGNKRKILDKKSSSRNQQINLR